MTGVTPNHEFSGPVTLEGLMRVMIDVQGAVGGLTQQVGTLARDTNVNTLALQGAKTQLADLVRAVGEESIADDGTKKGTGLFGRVARLENAKLVYDRWTNRAIGMAMAATVLISVVWWLINDKLEHVLKGSAG